MKLIFTRNISFPGNILDEVIKEISGNFTVRTTPVPIPNTAVNPYKVDGTCLARGRESRTLPD